VTDESQPSMEELKARLKNLGLDQWDETEGKRAIPPFLLGQRKSLETLRKVAETLVEKDQETLAELQGTLHRLKHGGGR